MLGATAYAADDAALQAEGTVDAALQAAVASPTRTPANVARDPARHPAQTLAFFGIKPDQTVVELVPGNGWYTEILAPYLRAHGQLIEAGSDPEASSEDARRGAAKFKAWLDAKPQLYDRVRLGVFDARNGRFDLGRPGAADLVLTFRNVHNWAALGDAQTRAAFKAMFDALKPGGVLGVVDHRLPPDREQDAKASTGYLHESYVIAMAESAGFKLAARAEINANPKDHADHPGGVWALPPSFEHGDQDRAKYEAIGESDRMTLKFVKP
ncbi:MAG: class I SAM-dependent methyltransferase [Pelomonas sp.]|nr:class I SAM-dependent methyltransferase [Roseateles sp.]